MPVNDVEDISYPRGNISGTGKPMLNVPTLAPWLEGYVDATANPAGIGKLIRLSVVATNTGGAFFVQSSVASEAFLNWEVGVVQSPAAVTNTVGYAVKRGVVPALCTTTGSAIALGTLLVADGAGNLTPASGTPTPGQIVARALGTLASGTSTPTLVNVYIGGV